MSGQAYIILHARVNASLFLLPVVNGHSCIYSRAHVVLEELEDTKKGNQNPYIEEEQTTQWPKEKVQKDKQR